MWKRLTNTENVNKSPNISTRIKLRRKRNTFHLAISFTNIICMRMYSTGYRRMFIPTLWIHRILPQQTNTFKHAIKWLKSKRLCVCVCVCVYLYLYWPADHGWGGWSQMQATDLHWTKSKQFSLVTVIVPHNTKIETWEIGNQKNKSSLLVVLGPTQSPCLLIKWSDNLNWKPSKPENTWKFSSKKFSMKRIKIRDTDVKNVTRSIMS